MVRIKNRYLLVNILYPQLEQDHGKTNVADVISFNRPTTDNLNAQALLRALRSEIAMLFGDYGSGATSESLSVKYLSTATSTFILKVARAHYQLVWAALSLMTTVPVKDGKSCVFRVVRVSGTIRKAEEEAIRRAREMILKARRDIGQNSGSTLDSMFANEEVKKTGVDKDLLMPDRSDSDDNDEALSSDADG